MVNGGGTISLFLNTDTALTTLTVLRSLLILRLPAEFRHLDSSVQNDILEEWTALLEACALRSAGGHSLVDMGAADMLVALADETARDAPCLAPFGSCFSPCYGGGRQDALRETFAAMGRAVMLDAESVALLEACVTVNSTSLRIIRALGSLRSRLTSLMVDGGPVRDEKECVLIGPNGQPVLLELCVRCLGGLCDALRPKLLLAVGGYVRSDKWRPVHHAVHVSSSAVDTMQHLSACADIFASVAEVPFLKGERLADAAEAFFTLIDSLAHHYCELLSVEADHAQESLPSVHKASAASAALKSVVVLKEGWLEIHKGGPIWDRQ
uniref:Uncharacterized protein n=1 Tax=Haptolina brevifila TaxID=156173 RepID=A0A7S2D073_9EUKA|mmetsp:Transcript_31283/g.62580  ORF Transcript_31283/g.62580 Transcript_31283/m.62580 type:complete len:325 (+) Transcript_31283:279-1253(+)